MNALSPSWFPRVVRRLLCGWFLLSFCAAAVIGAESAVTEQKSLDGFWTLDLKRSEGWPTEPFLTATARTRVQGFDARKHDPALVCMPYGMPRVMGALGAFPMEIVQTDSQVTMIFDPHEEVRRVLLRRQPDIKEELAPLWLGYAYGKWDGATLVVETIGITDQSLVDATGIPHSGQLRVVERIRRVDATTLLNEMTLHDAAAFTRPITRKLYYSRVPEGQQREFHCPEQQWLDHVMDRAKALTREMREPAEKKP